MATPRLFISSTCYDLKEVRHQLRTFIEDVGYEPVMSDYGDIFYDYKKHIQDSCKTEIEKCQLFILIIGNQYGSYYHKQKEQGSPDSVTLQELKKALETNIYKHIFINKFVEYDYRNFTHAQKIFIGTQLDGSEYNEKEYDQIINNLKKEFEQKYFFPQESYKKIFKFLDIIYSLKSNNAIIPYESFDEIKDSLRKQWAGFMYNELEKKESVPLSIFKNTSEKIAKIENQLQQLLTTKISKENGSNKISFDLSKIENNQSLSDLESIKDTLYNTINRVICDRDYDDTEFHNVVFLERVSKDLFVDWLIQLDLMMKKYKWAQTISVIQFYQAFNINFKLPDPEYEIQITDILDFLIYLQKLKAKLDESEYQNLLDIVVDRFNKMYESNEIIKEKNILETIANDVLSDSVSLF